MNHLLKVIKGSLVGLGSILPGISGSMVATILNIYQDLIVALNQFTKHPIKAILSVWQYILGVGLGYVIGFLFIKTFFENFPIPFTLLFIGFILGSIPSVTKETRGKKKNWHHLVTMALAIVFMVLFLFVQEASASASNCTYYLVIFVIGFITAASLITPGLSAATLLMALGVASVMPMLLILALGVLVGMIVMGKLMYQILIHYRLHFYMAILGIIIISPFNILFELQSSTEQNVFQTHWLHWVIGAILCIGGFILTYVLSTKDIVKEVSHD
jgi:putative membrane protein